MLTTIERARVGAPPQLNPGAELDGIGALLYRYAYGSMAHSPHFVVNASGETYRVIRDQLGSPLLVVNIDDANDVLFEARHSAFGQRTVVDGDGGALTLGFAGGIYDEDTGLTRFGARDYDAAVGRWTAKDPILWGGGQGNLYGYVGGDPVNRLEPNGLRVTAGDYRGQQLIDLLNRNYFGSQLLEYLQTSPLNYVVHTSSLDSDVAGRFGDSNACSSSQEVRVNSLLLQNEAFETSTLGHELGHAALYRLLLGSTGTPLVLGAFLEQSA